MRVGKDAKRVRYVLRIEECRMTVLESSYALSNKIMIVLGAGYVVQLCDASQYICGLPRIQRYDDAQRLQ